MEVRINKEVRDYTESIFFGLSLRQFAFSLLAVLVAVGLYFAMSGVAGTEEIGWVCILGAAPFAACGFFKYNGMPAERFIAAWLRSEFVYPKELKYKSENIYAKILRIDENPPRLSTKACRRSATCAVTATETLAVPLHQQGEAGSESDRRKGDGSPPPSSAKEELRHD